MEHRTRTLPFAAIAVGLLATPLLAGTALAQMAAQPETTHGTAAGMTPPAATSGAGTASPGMQTMPAEPISHATIQKAGKALHNVLAINQQYGAKLSGTTDSAAKQQLVAAAKQKAMGAIRNQGLSVNQYNEVLASAQQNPTVRQQLLSDAGVKAQQ
ncbi:MAG: DUF4168 domain-containing protein [Acidiphilium sp.]